MDEPKHDPDETPLQRALRLKNAALEARGKAPAAGKVQRGSATQKAGASKPWVKR